MNKLIVVLLTFSSMLLPAIASANSGGVRIVSVCGLYMRQSDFVRPVKQQIDISKLHSRVDNERFNACPYWLELDFGGKLSMRIDFIEDLTQDNIEQSSGNDIIGGGFNLVDGRWIVLNDQLEPDASVIVAPIRSESETFVVSDSTQAGVRNRCMGFLLIGPEKSATGRACSLSGEGLSRVRKYLLTPHALSFRPKAKSE